MAAVPGDTGQAGRSERVGAAWGANAFEFRLTALRSVQGQCRPECPELSLRIKIVMAVPRCCTSMLLSLKPPNSSAPCVHVDLASGFRKHFILQQHSR